MNQSFNVVIPARYASTRLPGKPLADIGGRPMIARVVDQALRSGAAQVVVASDDERVLDAVRALPCQARMTRADHVSGSDRVMEVAVACGWSPDTVVVNVQGDEPLIPPQVIAQVARLLLGDPDTGVATLCELMSDRDRVFDPNVVKVVVGSDGFARYFSRAPIPFSRDGFGASEPAAGRLPEVGHWRRHIGLYAYRLAALRHFVELPVGELERVESLEQLRLVERGIGIRIAEAAAQVPGGVDTPEDLERVRRQLAAER
ncbi:MAG: 3-deoxy-manno-octulosonate cytidylyltransferase [Pseudomonadales bacterium]